MQRRGEVKVQQAVYLLEMLSENVLNYLNFLFWLFNDISLFAYLYVNSLIYLYSLLYV